MQITPTEIPEPPIDRAVRRAGEVIVPDAGKAMADYVTAQLRRSIYTVSAGALTAGLAKENAVACFILLCREVCDELCCGAVENMDMN